jgi:hypothetical protein
MLPDETCWFLAADFDKKSWKQDVAAFRDSARAKRVPVAIERSRSGNGAHAWIFFREPVGGSDARRLGSLLVTATMDRCPDIGFDSYDRFFPSQDTMPAGGFGNLIALPFQSRPREIGNSVFVDDDSVLTKINGPICHRSTVYRGPNYCRLWPKLPPRDKFLRCGFRRRKRTMNHGLHYRPAAARNHRSKAHFQIWSRSCWVTKSISIGQTFRRV